MALAILELVALEQSAVRFKIDTGTNRFYKLKVGRSLQQRYGLDWADDVYFTSTMGTNPAGGSLFNSTKEIAIPTSRFDKGTVYVQLFSFKNAQGRSPAISNVVEIPMGGSPLQPGWPARLPINGFRSPGLPRNIDTLQSLPGGVMIGAPATFQPARRAPCRTCGEVYPQFSQTASLEDIFGTILKLAGPLLQGLVGGAGGAAGAAQGAQTQAPASDPLGGVLTGLLGALLKSIPGLPGMPLLPGMSKGASLEGPLMAYAANHLNRFDDEDDGGYNGFGYWNKKNTNGNGSHSNGNGSNGSNGAAGHHRHRSYNHYHDNRFMEAAQANYARPMIFGIDDAILGTLVSQIAGPVLQVLPQLLNSVQQARLQNKLANNKLTTDILSGINQRLLIQQLNNAKQSQPNSSADLDKLIQMIQQAQPAADGSAPVATASSLDYSQAVLSSKAVVSFVTADALPWNGTPKAIFSRGQTIQLKVRLDVAAPAPKTALPKAIFKFTFKNSADQAVLFEKTFKQKNLQANSVLPFAFDAGELAHIPANQPLTVMAEMRWLAPTSGNEYKALGSAEIVLVNKYFLKEQGETMAVEQELTDMKRFRPFWNKIWEAPVLDTASNPGGDRQYNWGLNVNIRYSMVISAEHTANGLMETRLLQPKPDRESLTARTEGRMKAGIELSVSELNKLIPLWNGAPALDAPHLEAFQTAAYAQNNSGEFINNIKLQGRAGERGMVWVMPVFKLCPFTLNTVQKTDDAGQVIAVADEKVNFPVPSSGRLLGLKSQ